MLKLKTGDVRANLADTLNQIIYRGERVILCRRDKELAAMVSMDDLKLLEEIEDAKDLKDAKRILKRIEEGKEEVYSLTDTLNMLAED